MLGFETLPVSMCMMRRLGGLYSMLKLNINRIGTLRKQKLSILESMSHASTRWLFLALVMAVPGLFAQSDTATVLGTVTDPQGAVIPNSKVTLSNLANGTTRDANSDANGNFEFFNVRIGDYRLKAEATGFKAAIAERFNVTVNARQRVDLHMQIGATTENVIVTDAAAVLETDSSDRGQVIRGQAIVNLPLNGRSYADLALLSPGVRKSVLQNQTSASRDASYNVNGQRSALNNFSVDGVDNNAYGTSNQGFSNQVVQITPDAVAEFRVQTNNYSAEFGRAAGAVINATIKSGTNTFHGSAWEFLRNTSLNAVGFFKPAQGVKPTFIQNQFGGTFGGAIKKDKLFFFADYEGLERVQRSLQFATVPTVNQRAGRFPVPVRNPITGVTYQDGVVPASDQIPFAKAVLNALPVPNVVNLDNPFSSNFASLPRDTISDHKGDFRIDDYFSTKLTGFFRYSERLANIFVAPNIPGPAGGNSNGNVRVLNKQLVPGINYTLSPTSVIEARLGVTWTEGGKSPIGLGEPSLLTANGITGLPTDPQIASALNSISVGGGYSQFGRQGSNPQFQNPYVINPRITYSKLWGKHSIKTGYEYQRIDTAVDDFNPVFSSENYNGQFSRPAGVGSASAAEFSQAYNLADFMFGARNHYELNNFVIIDLRQRMHFGYVQDDWKVSQKLTVNAGLRYEFATPQWEEQNRLANFDPATKSLIPAKSGDLYSRSLVQPKHNNWAPRLGAAYRVLPKTVLRAAYGISYVQFNRLGGENLLSYNGPAVVDATIDQSPLTQPICGPNDNPSTCFRPTQQGYPANFAVPANFNTLNAQARYIPKDNPTGYVQSWHFTVQQQLTPTLTLDIGYVGNRGTHLMILGDWNQAALQAPGGTVNLQQRRPISNFNFIEVAYGAGSSSYNALQVKLEKRFSGGLYALNSFTWSKGLDNASGHLEANNGDNSRVNIRDLRNEKGLSGYDQPFNDTLSFIWDLPYGRSRRFGSSAHGLAQAVFGGWQLSVINTLTSGLPINITYDVSTNYTVSSAPTYRPNLFGNPVTPEGQRSTENYFNKTAFSNPIDSTHSNPFGNAGRNIARGYSFFQLDTGLHKQFPLWSEASKLEFRTEAFNLTNQTNFGPPNSNFSSGGFGQIRSTFPARQVQFALKLIF
jgi:hypothetical protein